MKLRLAVSAALLAMAIATPALSAELKYKPGEGPLQLGQFRGPEEGRPQGRDPDHFRPLAR